MVRTVGGCALCLDWTGGHLREACPYTEQFKACNMPGCGLMHNHLLHGTNVKFVNTVVANRTGHHKDLAAPSSGDVENSDRSPTLLQVQALQVRVQDGQCQGVACWDAGSNAHLVRRKFAEESGWSGVETTLTLQTTGGRPRNWSTKVYQARLIDI